MKAELSPEQLKWIKEKNYYNFKEAPKEWLESNEFMLQTLTDNTDGRFLHYASEKLKDDREIVLAAVTKSGSALEFASDKLKDDKEIVLAAVTKNGFYLQYASNRLKDDKEIVLVAVAEDGQALRYAPDKLKDDKEIVLAAVTNHGYALEYAPDKLKDDKEIVLTAVTNRGYSLQYASTKLKDDKEIVLVAVTNNGDALEYASEKLKDDKEILLAAVANDSSSLRFASEEAREYINKKLMEENEIKIGDQTWITKNLDVDTYRNGDVIPEVEDDWEWEDCCSSKTGAWCYYENEYNGTGKLYNWYAVNDPRGLAPKGYHIPSEEEWSILIDNIGDDNYPFSTATKMKSTAGWNNIRNGSNSSGFAGLPGGRRFCSGTFYGGGEEGNWWISTDPLKGGSEAMNIRLGKANWVSVSDKGDGLSVRCLRD